MSRGKRKQNKSLGKSEQLTDEKVESLGQEMYENAEIVTEQHPAICPIPTDPAMGDKTPEVMDWYREHAPEEYTIRYSNRVTPHQRGGRHIAQPVDRFTKTVFDPKLGKEVPISDFEDEAEPMKKPHVIMQ